MSLSMQTARKYGIRAVAGVHQATTRRKDGQRVRVDGTTGQIILLDGAPSPGESNSLTEEDRVPQ